MMRRQQQQEPTNSEQKVGIYRRPGRGWGVTAENGEDWTEGEKTDISGETKLTWANKIYKRIYQNFSRKFISINRYVHHYQGTRQAHPPVISLFIPSGHDRSGIAASQGCIVSGLPSEHINLFVSPQLLFIRPAWYNPIYIV